MSDTFIKWFLRFWFTALVLTGLLWIWRHFPYGLLVLAFVLLLIARNILGERRRRQAQGWWVEYLSPGQLRAGQDDIAVVYHEDDKQHFFSGKQVRPAPNILTVPSRTKWQDQVPEWMSDRRIEILERIQQDIKRTRRMKRIQVVEEKDA